MPRSRLITLIAALFLFAVMLEPAEAQRGRGKRAGAGKAQVKEQIADLTEDAKDLIKEGDFPEAEKLARSRLELTASSFGENHPKYGGSLTLLGRILLLQGHYSEAEALIRRGLALRESLRGANDVRTSASLLHLGHLLAARTNYAEAETLLRRSVAIRSTARQPEEYATALLTLGQLMKDLGRYAEAEALANQAIAVLDAAFSGERRGKTSLALLLLAQNEDEQGRTADAHKLAARALTIQERVFGSEHPVTGLTLVFVGHLLHELQRDQVALPLLERARTIAEKSLGGSHPQTGRAYLELALVQDALGRFAPAEQNYHAALKTVRNGAVPLLLAQANRAYGRYLVSRERLREALPYYREAITAVERVFAETRGQSEDIRQQFAGRFNVYHHELIDLLIRLHTQDSGAGHDREALAVASLTQSRIFSELLRQADVSQFSKDSGFADLNQQRVASVDRLRALRRELVGSGLLEHETADDDDDDEVKAVVAAPRASPATTATQQDTRGEKLRRQIDDAKQQLAKVEDALRRGYPRYMELTQPQPVTAAELQQRLLRPGEVALSYALLPRQLLVFAVTREQFMMAVLPQGRDALAAKIRVARAPEEESGQINALRKLDPQQLHELYSLLIAPVESVLGAGQRILVVGDGPIHTLPLEMLVTQYGDAERTAFATARERGPMLAEYATLPYLGARAHLNYLPSLAALSSQRLYPKPPVVYDREIVSFADPVFEREAGGTDIGAPTRTALDLLSRNVRGDGQSINIPRLPETADEARDIAKILGGKSQIYLRHEAQEHLAKSLDLKTTRYLHFATHGLLGGEFLLLQQAARESVGAGAQRNLTVGAAAASASAAGSGAPSQSTVATPGDSSVSGQGGQPALALTLVGDLRGEDGLLTMKEVIESLDLNAQLVVLSACNTAGEGAEARNGEGFAGLTRSFMYAGAKALLVSHWSVESLSTQQFITDVFRIMKQGRSVGEAMFEARRTMLASSTADHSRAHPYFWAPFVNVGD